MTSQTEQNKQVVLRFNKECIEQGSDSAFQELVATDCINHTAPEGVPNGPDGMKYFLYQVLRPGFPDLEVHIKDQVAEGNKVVTQKELHGTHNGTFMGVGATGTRVVIHVTDIIELRNGQYIGHWGMSNLDNVVAELSAARKG